MNLGLLLSFLLLAVICVWTFSKVVDAIGKDGF